MATTTNITEVNVVEVQTGKSASNIAELRKNIKDLKSELLGLEQGTDEYNDKLLELGNAQHQLVELNEQMRATNQDFGTTISNTTRLIGGMSGAVQAVTGTLSLLGVQIGDDTQLMKFLVSAMSITQGVAAIDAGIKSFKALAVSIQTATSAQKLFNLTALKNPYLIAGAAIVASITAIVVALRKLKKEEDERHKEVMNNIEEENNARRRSVLNRTKLEIDYFNEYRHLTQKEQQEKKKQAQQRLEDLKNSKEDYRRVNADLEKIYQEERKREQALSEVRKKYERGEKTENAVKWTEQQLELYRATIESNVAYQEYRKTVKEYAHEINETNAELNALEQLERRGIHTKEEKKKATKEATEVQKDEYTLYERMSNQIALNAARGEEALVTLDKQIALEKTQLTMLEEGTEAYDKQLIVIAELEKQRKELLNDTMLSNIESEKRHKLSVAENEDLENQIRLLQVAQSLERPTTFGDIEEQREQALAVAEFTKQTKLDTLQANYEAEVEALNKELALVQTTEERKREIRDESARLQTEYRLNVLQTEQEFADQVVEIDKKATDERKNMLMSYMDAVLFITDNIASVFGSIADAMEQGTREWKNLKIAEAIISTLAGGVAAMMSVWKDESIPSVWLKIAMMATLGASTLAAGFAQVKKIQETQVSKSSSSGVSTNSVAVQRIANNPSNVRQTSPTWNDEGEIEDNVVGEQRVTLVYSDLEAMGGRKASVENNNRH